MAKKRFLYPELGSVDEGLPKDKQLAQLAGLVTSPENGRFARTIVNRLWGQLLGRGIIEPTDDMDATPWSSDLLDWLASDFVAKGYDIKLLIEQIVTSDAYQFAAVRDFSPEDKGYVFEGPVVRHLSAEQYIDAVESISKSWVELDAEDVTRSVEHYGSRGGALRSSETVAANKSRAIEVDVTGAKELFLVAVPEKEKERKKRRRKNRGLDDPNSGTAASDEADFKSEHENMVVWQAPVLSGGTEPVSLTELPWQRGYAGGGLIEVVSAGNDSGQDSLRVRPLSVVKYEVPEGGQQTFTATVRNEAVKGALSVQFMVLTDVSLKSFIRQRTNLTGTLGRPSRSQVVTKRTATATAVQALELMRGDPLRNAMRNGARSMRQEIQRTPQND